MAKTIFALLAGILFGLGLGISQMASPQRVLGFFDFFGHWDYTLALVMAGALTVSLLTTNKIIGIGQPLLDQSFHLPMKTQVDIKLLSGAAMFGFGWGIAGYCPGPALANLVVNWKEAVFFMLAFVIGSQVAKYLLRWDEKQFESDDAPT